MCQIRIDRTCPVTQQCCKVVHFSRLTALQNHCHGSSLLRTDQMLLETRYRQKRRDRHMILIHVTVCQDQNICPAPDHPVNLDKEILNRFLKARILIIGDRDLCDFKSLHIHILNL